MQYMQSLFYKGFLKLVSSNHIRSFLPSGEAIYGGHDIGLEELESYHYDTIRSEKEGIDCYVKEFDHYNDCIRYQIMEFKLTGRAPVI